MVDAGQLYDQHWDVIFKFLQRKMPYEDAAEVEDVTALVFERVVKAASRYEDTGKPIRAWLFSIARNIRVDLIRRAIRRPVVCQFSSISDRGDRPEWELNSLAVEKLEEALACLAPRQRTTLLEYYILGAKTAETAELIGVTPNEVRKLRMRGLARLKQLLSLEELG